VIVPLRADVQRLGILDLIGISSSHAQQPQPLAYLL
jgi:hypothetical protein